MTFIRGRFWRTSVAAVAAWALACDSGGSEPNTPPVASVVVSPSSVELKSIGATQQLTATPLDASGTAVPGRSVSWATSNAVVARVSANGLVTGIAAGTTTVTATSEEKLGTALVSVATPPPATVAEVVVTPPSPSAWVGRSQQLTRGDARRRRRDPQRPRRDMVELGRLGRHGRHERRRARRRGRHGHHHRDQRWEIRRRLAHVGEPARRGDPHGHLRRRVLGESVSDHRRRRTARTPVRPASSRTRPRA